MEDEKIEKIETDINDIDYAIDKLEETINCLRDIPECEEIADYTEDDVNTLKIIRKQKQDEIEDLEEQEDYISDFEERRKEFERSVL